jgi:hypothetical protein
VARSGAYLPTMKRRSRDGRIVPRAKPLGRYAVGAMFTGIPVAFIVSRGMREDMPGGQSREIWIVLAALTGWVRSSGSSWSRNKSRSEGAEKKAVAHARTGYKLAVRIL